MAEPGPCTAQAYDGLICDLDGVVYRGQSAVPGAPDALAAFRALGLGVVYATNNAARRPAEVAAQLIELGVACTADDVVTSAQAGAAHLAASLPGGAKVLALGGPGVTGALRAVGLTPVAPEQAHEQVEAVLQGLGRELRVSDFEVAARHLTLGAGWVATNHDATFPLEWGLAPGNGAYVRLLEATTGRHPVVVGKPEPPLYELATQRLGTRTTRTLAVGDRLDTDIDGAGAAGLDCAWVLTGVDPPSALFRRPALPLPTYVVGSLAELLQPAGVLTAVPADADGVVGCRHRCGTATAQVQFDPEQGDPRARLQVGGPKGQDVVPMHVIRAGLAALVMARDRGDLPLAQVETLAHELDVLLGPGTGGTQPSESRRPLAREPGGRE